MVAVGENEAVLGLVVAVEMRDVLDSVVEDCVFDIGLVVGAIAELPSVVGPGEDGC